MTVIYHRGKRGGLTTNRDQKKKLYDNHIYRFGREVEKRGHKMHINFFIAHFKEVRRGRNIVGEREREKVD